jgi:hypothetical protein
VAAQSGALDGAPEKLMSTIKLPMAVVGVVLISVTLSITAVPAEAQARSQPVDEAEPDDLAAFPAIAAVAAAGLAGAFALGVAQGYLEARNDQKAQQAQQGSGTIRRFGDFGTGGLEYVLD